MNRHNNFTTPCRTPHGNLLTRHLEDLRRLQDTARKIGADGLALALAALIERHGIGS